jgi:hypothetical protein
MDSFISPNRNSRIKGYVEHTFRNPGGAEATFKSQPNPGSEFIYINNMGPWMKVEILNKSRFFLIFIFQNFYKKPFNNHSLNLPVTGL